jgi:hypothetical protein
MPALCCCIDAHSLTYQSLAHSLHTQQLAELNRLQRAAAVLVSKWEDPWRQLEFKHAKVLSGFTAEEVSVLLLLYTYYIPTMLLQLLVRCCLCIREKYCNTIAAV